MKKYQFPGDQLTLLERMRVPFAVYQFIDKRVVTLALSDGFCRMFGYTDRAQAYYDMDNDMYKETHPDDVARIANAAIRFATEGGNYEVIYRGKRNGGKDYKIFHAVGEHVQTETGERLAYVWYTDEGHYQEENESDLNRRLDNALREESLIRASHYDYLTGLPNMTYFFELAEAGKTAILNAGGEPVVLFLDLSGMKYYNHKHSFAEGNKLLQAFAKMMARIFSLENCCHVSADHFSAFTSREGMEEKLQLLFQEFRREEGGESMPIRVGVYPFHLEDVLISTACDRAKYACDSLRKTYTSGFVYYSRELRDDIDRRQYILTNLDRAISEKWIQVHYQPIVRAVNGKVCNEEALARWADPVKGLLPPSEFIPFLEEARLIYKLDLYVLDRVLEKIKAQQESGFNIVPHSVNLSRSDFDMCDIVEEIKARVDAAGVPRDKINVEITESTVGSDFEFIREQVSRFQKLGFSVWMDDFGSGYSSLDVLQSIQFDLIKFDMSFMKKLDDGDGGKIILTELMKMVTSLGVDTICEGVESLEQVRFLQEIGCSKLQGFYYCRPITLEALLTRYQQGKQIGYENPRESDYFEAIGRVNLYDLAVIANDQEHSFPNFFNTLPIGIIEVKDGLAHFIRTNKSYRDFMQRFFQLDLSDENAKFTATPFGPGSSFMKLVKQCCDQGGRVFFDEQMPDGSMVHSFVRRIGRNPVTGAVAAAIAVLSINAPTEGATYASIAKALAADYYNIYYVDLETEKFIEYSSPIGQEEITMERHGENFFEACKRDSYRIYEEDRETFFSVFSKEKIIQALEEQGVFNATYRLVDTGVPMYVSMKITRVQSDARHIIMGISIIDSQMKQKERDEGALRERGTLARIMALSEDYLSLYTIQPETGSYIEYSASDDYDSLGFAKQGEDFFTQGRIDGERTVWREDLSRYLQSFSRENVMNEIQRNGFYRTQYRLVIKGKPRNVSLKIAPFRDGSEIKLVAGVRAWQERR